MIKIAICDDDEIYISKILKPLLSRALKTLEICAEPDYFTNGNLLLREFQDHHNYNIVLLDIDMPSINGKQLAQKLRELDKNFWLAFISSYKEEVFNVFSLNIADFIPKDYDNNTCFDKLTELFQRYKSEKNRQKLFNVSDRGKHAVVNISLDNVLYFKTEKGNTVLYTGEENVPLTDRSLKKLERDLSSFGFFKIYSNILVNVGKVYEVLDNEIILSDRSRLPISRRRRRDLLAELSKVISAKVVTK